MFCIVFELDPFCSVFEFILPSAYERDVSTIWLILLIRIVLSLICAFEFCRFATINSLVGLCALYTMLACLKQIIKLSHKSLERTLLKLYTLIGVTVKIAEQFNRCALSLILTIFQFLLTTIWWMVFKCWDPFPLPFSLGLGIYAGILTLGVAFILPRVVLVSEISKEFVVRKTSQYQTFNRRNIKYCNFCRWRAQKMLAFRFGIQFRLNKDTPVIYLDILLANITNAILVVNPQIRS